MKITIETIEVDEHPHKSVVQGTGVTADEVLQECIQAMLGMGFQEESVEEAIRAKAEEIQGVW